MTKLFKITEDTYQNCSCDDIFSRLEQKPMEMVRELIDMEKSNILESIRDCESPIEMILAIAMFEVNLIDFGRYTSLDVINIENQAVIIIEKKKYRVDFRIAVYCDDGQFGKEFIIECDGHEFHEKTKEQVKKDNARKRKLMSKGYTIINFSGSEVFNNPYQCVNDIKEIITQTMKTPK